MLNNFCYSYLCEMNQVNKKIIKIITETPFGIAHILDIIIFRKLIRIYIYILGRNEFPMLWFKNFPFSFDCLNLFVTQILKVSYWLNFLVLLLHILTTISIYIVYFLLYLIFIWQLNR